VPRCGAKVILLEFTHSDVLQVELILTLLRSSMFNVTTPELGVFELICEISLFNEIGCQIGYL
jgi:hypothetical protein